MNLTFLIIIIIITTVECQSGSSKSGRYTIGVITMDDENAQKKLNEIAANLTLKKNNLKVIQLNKTENSIDLTISLCETFETSLYTVISLINKPIDSQTLIISFLCSYYQIPLISLYNRESIFIDKSVHSSFIRMTPSYFNEARIWVYLLNRLMFKTINFVHSVDDNGQLMSSKFQYLADQFEVNVRLQPRVLFNKIAIVFLFLRLKKRLITFQMMIISRKLQKLLLFQLQK